MQRSFEGMRQKQSEARRGRRRQSRQSRQQRPLAASPHCTTQARPTTLPCSSTRALEGNRQTDSHRRRSTAVSTLAASLSSAAPAAARPPPPALNQHSLLHSPAPAMSSSRGHRYSVLLPTYNERQNLPIIVDLLVHTFTTKSVHNSTRMQLCEPLVASSETDLMATC